MEPLDDLLIKRRRGALTAGERRRLDKARLAAPEYDLALLAHEVFEADGSAQPGDAERLRALVAGVERGLPRLPRASGRWRTMLRRLVPPLFVAGAAAASIGELLPPRPAAPLPATAPSAPRLPARVATSALAAPAPRPVPPPEPAVAPSPGLSSRRLEPSRSDASAPSPRPRAKPRALAPASPAPRPAAPAASPQPARGAEPEPALAESAQSLFRRAGRLRAVDWPAAAALYVELIQRHPSSNEAGVAEVALGKWELARGRSGDALEWFRAHQRRAPGALAAEALFGEARALESIGSDVEARGPWRKLLERYPTSPYADVARRRLAP